MAGALQADSKIVAAGSYGVARYNSDGSLDNSFSGDGEVLFSSLGVNKFYASSVAVRGNSILVAGRQYNSTGYSDFVVLSLNADGSLDPCFGDQGAATADFFNSTDYPQGIAVAPDGSIALVGYAVNPTLNRQEFAVARFTPKGRLDTDFNHTGVKSLDLGDYYSYATSAAF